MNTELIENIMLYHQHLVMATLADGTSVTGMLTVSAPNLVRIDETEYALSDFSDVLYAGGFITSYKNKLQSGVVDKVYQFSQADCDDSLPASLLNSIAFRCEIYCHLCFEDGKIVAKDLRLKQACHVYSSILNGTPFLYCFRDGSRRVATFSQTDDERYLLFADTNESVPFDGYTILEITKCPVINDKVRITLKSGAKYEGTVCFATDTSFSIIPSDMPEFSYQDIEEIRYFGQYHAESRTIDEKYSCKASSLLNPAEAVFMADGVRFSFVIDVNLHGLYAKNVQLEEKTDTLPVSSEELGIIVFCDISGKTEIGYIGKRFRVGKRDMGDVRFSKSLLNFAYDYKNFVYIVRYTSRMNEAITMELVEQIPISLYYEIRIDDENQIQKINYSHLGLMYAVGKLVRLTTDDSVDYCGFLTENADDSVTLSQDKSGINSIVQLPKARIHALRVWGRITSYDKLHGMGFIDNTMHFHVSGLKTPQYADLLPTHPFVSYTIIATNKGNGVSASTIICEETETQSLYVIGKTEDSFLVLDQDSYMHTRQSSKPEKVRIPMHFEALNVQGWDYRLERKRFRLQNEDFVLEEIGEYYEKLPKLLFGYIITYVQKENYGFFLHEEQYGKTDKGIYFNAPLQNMPSKMDTRKFDYYISYESTPYNGIKNVTILNAVKKAKVTPLPTEENAQFSDIPLEPLEGQTIEAFLNNAVSKYLKYNLLSRAMEQIAAYEDQVEPEFFHTLRHRVLQKQYKDFPTAENEALYLDCLNTLLQMTSKISFKMTMLLQKADILLRARSYEEAEKCYRAWQDALQEVIARTPSKAAGYSSWQNIVQSKLEICQNRDSLPAETESVPEEEELLPMDSISSNDYISAMLYHVSPPAVLGETFAAYEGLKDPDEDALSALRNHLEAVLQTQDKTMDTCWALAKIYNNALFGGYTLSNDDIHERDSWIFEALIYAAQKAVNADDLREHQKLHCQYLCMLALSIRSNAGTVAALYFSKNIGTHGMMRQQLENNLSLEELLSRHVDEIVMERFLYDSIFLFSKNTAAANYILDIFFGSDTLAPFLNRYVAALDAMLGIDEPSELTKETVSLKINRAVTESFRGLISRMTTTQNLSVEPYSKDLLLVLKDEKYAPWLSLDADCCEKLYKVLQSTATYTSRRGFKAKSELLRTSMARVGEMIDSIQRKPSCIADAIFLPKFSELSALLRDKYKQLCLTTRPVLQFLGCDAVPQPKNPDAEQTIMVTVPISGGANHGQTAMDVRLEIKENSAFILPEEIAPIPELQSGNESQSFTFPIILTDPHTQLITLEARVSYNYIADVKYEEARRGRYNRRSTVYTEEYRRVYSPSGNHEYKSIDIPVLAQGARELIDDRFIKLFPNDANMTYDNPHVREILKNREREIEQAISSITIRDTESDEMRLIERSRWVSLYGEWRVGKSTVLNSIKNRLENQFPDTAIIISMNCASSDETDFETAFAKKVYDMLWRAVRRTQYAQVYETLEEEYKFPDAINWDSMQDFLIDFAEGATSKNPHARLVLLLDEFTEIYQAIIRGNVKDRFPARWTEFIHNCNLLAITAGGEHTTSLMTTYAPNTLQKADNQICIHYLSAADMEKYVRFVVHDDQYFGSESEKVLARIYELTRGNAFLLKQFCEAMIEYVNEEQKLYITKAVIQATINRMIKKDSMDPSTVEARYFNSLYNPFNESDSIEEYAPDVKRIKNDQVRDDNLKILHEVVKLADRESHVVTIDALRNSLSDMDAEIFQDRMNTLIARGVLVSDDVTDTVRIYIDLYYEIVLRLYRGLL